MGRATTISAFARDAFAPLIDLVFPPRCPLCGEALATQTGLCSACWADLAIPTEPACSTCARPFPPGVEGGAAQCAVCLADPPLHSGIAAATLYNDASRKLILAFKHGRKIALAEQLGQLMAAKLPEPDGQPPLLVPVPLHRWRLWRRGFNQAALLARSLEKHGKGRVAVDVLVRQKSTPMLGGMRRKARERALKGAIAINRRWANRLKGRDVILVDDVLTSGATSNVCVKALRKAGVRSVKVACFARVLNEALGEQAEGHTAENITPEVTKTLGAT